MVAMNHPISSLNEPDHLLQSLLEQALLSAAHQRELLQQPEQLGRILNSIALRRWLFDLSRQTVDRHRALKARSLIILIMQYSGKIWRGTTAPQDYAEALARTWEWFSREYHTYQPEQSSFVTWFNQKLKWAICDVDRERQKRSQREQSLESSEDDSLDVPDPKLPTGTAEIFYEQIVDLVQRDPGHYLHQCTMQNHIHVTCKKVILAILQFQPASPNIPWDNLARQFEVDSVRLRNFCNSTAFPHFRQFCHLNKISF